MTSSVSQNVKLPVITDDFITSLGLLVSQRVYQHPPPDLRLHAFGLNIRRLREAKGLSLGELAELSLRGLVYIEHGLRNAGPRLSVVTLSAWGPAGLA